MKFKSEVLEFLKQLDVGVNRTELLNYIFLKLNSSIERPHIKAIISVLFEEILNDMIEFKELKINNLGIIHLKNFAARFRGNIITNEKTLGRDYNKLTIKFTKEIIKKLKSLIDPDTIKSIKK